MFTPIDWNFYEQKIRYVVNALFFVFTENFSNKPWVLSAAQWVGFFFPFEETIIHLPGEWQLTFFVKIPGLFLPAVVRPMLDSFESSKQVPQPALSDVSIEFWFMINFLIHWQNYGCLSSLQYKFKQVPFLALVVLFSILMPFTLCFVM